MKKIVLSVAAVLLIGLLAACNEDDTNEEKTERVTSVETVKVIVGDLVIEKSVYGRTSPMSTTPVMVQMPGEIDVLEVENGDKVEEDDLIATIATPAGKQNIRASRDGEITSLEAAEGDMISDSEPLAVIANMDSVKVTFSVTSDVRSLFKKEDKLTIVLADEDYDAEITSISTMPDDTGLYPVEATVENKEGTILPGMVGTMYVAEKRITEAIIIPTAAVVEENDETFVYVIQDEQAVKTTITIKDTQSDETAAEGDIQAGDQVVVSGQLTLSDGDQVNVVRGE
ncbi:efflux RND transporter periplasmic adaptor subunit [Virgibacillus sp. C22-A2]|uniref:Efflux RND transporter periplasmic adaptor subunit n=1 Tax=Virgibacillus tibetensis TaxID=3042313 RepID=A0ABU6KGT1_9BACI|nr:efflux RND transporter periplasmic adaptor subunit [Virgibacillus sp. C22-A2]